MAICGDPAAKAVDDAMGEAFRALLGSLAGPEKEAALEDQRAWIASRNAHCPRHSQPPAICAREKAEARIVVLSARPETGPGLPGRLQPSFLRRVSEKEGIEIEVQIFRFSEPRTEGERLLDRMADEAAERFREASADFTRMKKESPGQDTFSHHETWTIAYASPAFLSIWSEQDAFSGGAHGMYGADGLNIDLRKGRLLSFDDLFKAGTAQEITRRCVAEIEKNDGERLEPIEDDDGSEKANREERAAKSVQNLGSWSFTENEARVYFGVGMLGSTYAEGAFTCTLPLADLAKQAKVPLPPGR